LKFKKLIIFGAGAIADLALYYFRNDSEYDVCAFTVDREYCDAETNQGLPLIPFDEICSIYPPHEFDLFVAVGYSSINHLRKEKYEAGKQYGYNMPSYISTKATVFTDQIGDNCLLLEGSIVEPFVTIGSNTTLWTASSISHHSTVEDHCFISTHVAICGSVTIGSQSFLGANSTIRDHVTIGARCVIGAGCLILADTAPNGVYTGSATIRGERPSNSLPRI